MIHPDILVVFIFIISRYKNQFKFTSSLHCGGEDGGGGGAPRVLVSQVNDNIIIMTHTSTV